VALAWAGATDRKSAERAREMEHEDRVYARAHGSAPARPWQMRWLEDRIPGPSGKLWADHWLAAPSACATSSDPSSATGTSRDRSRGGTAA
jgi:hypothetical protein